MSFAEWKKASQILSKLMNPIVRVQKISKQYRIGVRASYDTLRESIMGAVREPFNRLRRRNDLRDENIWALKDISFEVESGAVLGVIGRNGAGKSTLLKVLSRITEPTCGRIELYGRIASLLEIGTGFHPELTGRENIYLNGAILGMHKDEIDRKFDEIVAFSELEKFLDTPVKRYSSGMYMRLAFAVASHLEPEILIVDEVLAVGDAAFQKKCLGKMNDVAKAGRTVLFVSHNMGAVAQLCTRAIVLMDGQLVFDGDVPAAIDRYMDEMRSTENSVTFADEPQKDVQILSMSVVSSAGEVLGAQSHTEPFSVLAQYRISKWKIGSYVCLDVFNEADVRLLWSSDITSVDEMSVERQPGVYVARITIPGMVLAPGNYYFTAAVFSPVTGSFDVRERAVCIQIVDGGSLLSNFGIKPHAATMIQLDWETVRLKSELSARCPSSQG